MMERLRPVLVAIAAMAVVATSALVAFTATADRNKAEDKAVEALGVARDAAAAADSAAGVGREVRSVARTVKSLLESQQARDVERQPLVDAAIARIIGDNAEAHAALLGEIARLVNRPVPAAAAPPGPRTAPTTATTVAPRARVSSAPRPTTPAPTTTTTTCPKRGNSEKCR